MLMTPLMVADVPAARLFPGWRGQEPFAGRLAPALAMLHARAPGLAAAIAAVPLDRFEAAHGEPQAVHKYNVVPEAARALFAALPEEVRAPYLSALMIHHMARPPASIPSSRCTTLTRSTASSTRSPPIPASPCWSAMRS